MTVSATVVSPLKTSASVTTSAAIVGGFIGVYDATSANLTPHLPALSGLAVGTQAGAQKSELDVSAHTVTVTCAGSDTFDDGDTTLELSRVGELRVLQVVSLSGTKHWKVVGGHDTTAGLTAEFDPAGSASTIVAAAIEALAGVYEAHINRTGATVGQAVVLADAGTGALGFATISGGGGGGGDTFPAGHANNPITDPTATRPTGIPVVWWYMTGGTVPVHLATTGGLLDIVLNGS